MKSKGSNILEEVQLFQTMDLRVDGSGVILGLNNNLFFEGLYQVTWTSSKNKPTNCF